MNRTGWKKAGLLLAIVLGSGGLRIPLEKGLVSELRPQGFYPQSQAGDLPGQVGVQGAIGLMGGLRYMVAALLELEAFRLWEPPPQWEKLSEAYALINLLQPKNLESWETAAWHHLYNASGYYRHDEHNLPPLQCEVMARDYEQRGIEILKNALRWNPGDVQLHMKLADAYRYKLKDFCKAAEVYRAAAALPDAPAFCYRFYGYSLAKCPGKQREAYAVLRQVYAEGLEVFHQHGRLIWKPTLIVELNRLERELGIPLGQRIPERFDEGSFRIATPLLPRESYPLYRSLLERGHPPAPGAPNEPDPQLLQTILELEKTLGLPQEECFPRAREGNATGFRPEVVPP